MARLAGIMAALQARLQPGEGQRPGRPKDPEWVEYPKVPMKAATQQALERLAELASTPERKVSPMQVAAQILEEAVARLAAEADGGQGV